MGERCIAEERLDCRHKFRPLHRAYTLQMAPRVARSTYVKASGVSQT
jgi:hypothetical protein